MNNSLFFFQSVYFGPKSISNSNNDFVDPSKHSCLSNLFQTFNKFPSRQICHLILMNGESLGNFPIDRGLRIFYDFRQVGEFVMNPFRKNLSECSEEMVFKYSVEETFKYVPIILKEDQNRRNTKESFMTFCQDLASRNQVATSILEKHKEIEIQNIIRKIAEFYYENTPLLKIVQKDSPIWEDLVEIEKSFHWERNLKCLTPEGD